MEACESGQGLTAAAISSRLFVRWASHRRPLLRYRSGDAVRPLARNSLHAHG